MKPVTIPAERDKAIARGKTLTLGRKACTGAAFSLSIIIILLFIAAFVMVCINEFGQPSGETQTLLWILAGAFLGGAVLLVLPDIGLTRLATALHERELDYREQMDGENSFFVGEGTLATFGKDSLRIHAEAGGKEEIEIPYLEMRFFSVCVRHSPCEHGEWSVVIEIPARYLAKNPKEGDPPALVQTDGKERLLHCLKAHGLELTGEEVHAGSRKKFTPRKKIVLPERSARKRALIFMGLGAVLMGAGIGVAFWQVTVGAVLAFVGATVSGKAFYSFLGAKRVLSFYDEGVFWKEKSRPDSVFLKWDEVVSVAKTEHGGVPLLKFSTAYGAYHFPAAEGAEDYLREHAEEKLKNGEPFSE